ncbi:MAG: sugar phosphate isomerase/epimerase [Caldiserica bacterium]|nr:sugar phosphate isomerase/epimerase [Caldisericota bacterium]
MKIGITLPRAIEEVFFTDILTHSPYVEVEATWFLDREGREKIKSLLESNKIVSVHLPLGEDYDISFPPTKNKAIDTIKRILDNLPDKKLKLILHPGDTLKKGEREEARAPLSLASIQEILSLLRGTPWEISLENMPPGYVGSSLYFLKFLFKELATEKVGMCLDTGHGNLSGTLPQLIENFAEKIVTFHLHDNDKSGDKHLQIPYGTIKWERIIPYTRNKNIILESPPWGRASISWMLKEAVALIEGRMAKQEGYYLCCPRCKHFLLEEKGKKVCYCEAS